MGNSNEARWGSIDLIYTTKSSAEEKLKIFEGTMSGERKMLRFSNRVMEQGGNILEVHYD